MSRGFGRRKKLSGGGGQGKPKRLRMDYKKGQDQSMTKCFNKNSRSP
ncbi:hypothetical protein [Bartonella phoceensis]|nr:hypothetical protein [Bartonella phoceensis]